MKEKQKNELRSGVRSVEGDLYESGLEVIERKVRRLEDAKKHDRTHLPGEDHDTL